MGRLLRILGILVVLIVVAIAALVYFVPLDSFKGPIQTAASTAIGRVVKIDGRLHFAVYPEIGLSAGNVSISNVEGGRNGEFARVDDMILGVKLIPLLSRSVEVTNVVLQKPVIHLEVAKDGSSNWTFKTGQAAQEPQAQEAPASGGAPSAKVSVASVKITDGEISYYDARSNKSEAMTDADLVLTLPALNEPATVEASFVYKMKTLKVTARVADIESYMGDGATDASLAVSSDVVNMDFNGTLKRAGASSGNLKLAAPSLRALTTWTAGKPIQTGGIDKLSLEGAVSSDNGRYAFSKAKIALDNMNISADIAVDTRPAVPMVTGTISADHLDLGPYMQADASGGGNASGKAGKDEWSDEKIALDGLKAANANVTINVGRLSVQKFVLDKAGQLKVLLQGGKLTADFSGVSLYGGSGSGRLVADASSPRSTFATTIAVQSVQMKEFLSTLIDIDRIEGTGGVSIDVSSRGESQKQIIEGLAGKASISVKNGAIRGVDLAAVARTLESALTGNLSQVTGERATTDFAEAGGNYRIQNGVMHNEDFHLLNPFVRILGEGDVDLGRRSLNYRLEPRAVTSREGQGGKLSLGGVGVPFHVHGAWNNIHYEPDMVGLAKGLVTGVGDGATGIGGLLGNALGGRKTNDSTQKSRDNDLGSALKGLFGGQ